jgi:hypothetical protein
MTVRRGAIGLWLALRGDGFRGQELRAVPIDASRRMMALEAGR